MGTRWGTSHFVSYEKAVAYYSGYNNTQRAVDRKLLEGEIHIGRPAAKPGEKIVLDKAEGRYWIEEAQPEQNNCDGSGPHTPGEVRVMPTGGDGNLILCRQCWENELAYRRNRNRSLGVFAQFDIIAWNDAKVYETV